MKCSCHFACYGSSYRETEFLAETCTYSGSRLNNNVFIGIVYSIPNVAGVIFFTKCANRTGNDTLTAVYTGNRAERLVKRACDFCGKTSVGSINNRNCLNVLSKSIKLKLLIITCENRNEFLNNKNTLVNRTIKLKPINKIQIESNLSPTKIEKEKANEKEKEETK